MRLASRKVLESQTLVKLDRSPILQPRGQEYLLPFRVGTLHRVLQSAGTDAAVLTGRLYLDLPNSNPIILPDQLNHAHPFALNFHCMNAAALPKRNEMSRRPLFIPRLPRSNNELQVRRAPERIQPLLIFFRRRSKTVLHDRVTTHEVMRWLGSPTAIVLTSRR